MTTEEESRGAVVPLEDEHPRYSIADAAEFAFSYRPSYTTLYRWTKIGVKSGSIVEKLECGIGTGNRKFTTGPAIARFLIAIAARVGTMRNWHDRYTLIVREALEKVGRTLEDRFPLLVVPPQPAPVAPDPEPAPVEVGPVPIVLAQRPYTCQQVADMLGVTATHIYHECRRQEIGFFRVGKGHPHPSGEPRSVPENSHRPAQAPALTITSLGLQRPPGALLRSLRGAVQPHPQLLTVTGNRVGNAPADRAS